MKYYSLFAILFLFVGCSKTVTLDIASDEKEKIVLYGFISPQEGVELKIFKSTPTNSVSDWSDYLIEDAKAIVYYQNEVLDTLKYIGNGNYVLSSNIPILATESYEIKVWANGLDSVLTHVEIPPLMNPLSSTANSGNYQVEIDVSFDYDPELYYYFGVTGFDSTGVIRPISSQGFLDEACPFRWTLPHFFASGLCFMPSGISTKINKQTYEYNSGGYTYLARIKYHISIVDEKYADIFYYTDDDEVGITEPILSKSLVQGGYGFVLPINYQEVVIDF